MNRRLRVFLAMFVIAMAVQIQARGDMRVGTAKIRLEVNWPPGELTAAQRREYPSAAARELRQHVVALLATTAPPQRLLADVHMLSDFQARTSGLTPEMLLEFVALFRADFALVLRWHRDHPDGKLPDEPSLRALCEAYSDPVRAQQVLAFLEASSPAVVMFHDDAYLMAQTIHTAEHIRDVSPLPVTPQQIEAVGKERNEQGLPEWAPADVVTEARLREADRIVDDYLVRAIQSGDIAIADEALRKAVLQELMPQAPTTRGAHGPPSTGRGNGAGNRTGG